MFERADLSGTVEAHDETIAMSVPAPPESEDHRSQLIRNEVKLLYTHLTSAAPGSAPRREILIRLAEMLHTMAAHQASIDVVALV